MNLKLKIYFALSTLMTAGPIIYIFSTSSYLAKYNVEFRPVIFGHSIRPTKAEGILTINPANVPSSALGIHDEGTDHVAEYTRNTVFLNDHLCGPNQTFIQNRHPRRPWTVQEYPCGQLLDKPLKEARCIPEAEFITYSWSDSHPKVIGWTFTCDQIRLGWFLHSYINQV